MPCDGAVESFSLVLATVRETYADRSWAGPKNKYPTATTDIRLPPTPSMATLAGEIGPVGGIEWHDWGGLIFQN
jgi:hypothetical protein